MSERKRSANWLLPEKLLLLDLVTDHFSIIENKKTDGVSMKQKNAEWSKISEEFNSQTNNNFRTSENLKAQWESMKKYTKKVASSARQSLIQTGGGPAKPKDNDPIHERILELISTSAIGLHNKFDCDNITNKESEEHPTQDESAHAKVSDVPEIYTVPNNFTGSSSADPCLEEQVGELVMDWGDYTPKMQQTPISTSLQFVQKSPLSEAHTPKTSTAKKAKQFTSKRRPTHPTSGLTADLQTTKIKALEMQMNFAKTEKEEAHQLFKKNLEIKDQILKQEKIKTRLLLAQLRKNKKMTVYNKTIYLLIIFYLLFMIILKIKYLLQLCF